LVNEEQNPRRCDFFVSYTGVDTAWAEWIAWQLKEAGYAVTVQAWHFRPGMNFVALMGQALDRCQRTVAIVSRAYLEQSIYGSDEWTAAFTHDDPTSSGLLLVLVEPVSLPRLLRPWIHISLAGLEPEPAAVRLLEGVRSGPAEPTKAPAFPGRLGLGRERWRGRGTPATIPRWRTCQRVTPRSPAGTICSASCVGACTRRGRRWRWCRPRRCMGLVGSARPSWRWSTPTATRLTTT
jgi:TIR domain